MSNFLEGLQVLGDQAWRLGLASLAASAPPQILTGCGWVSLPLSAPFPHGHGQGFAVLHRSAVHTSPAIQALPCVGACHCLELFIHPSMCH